MNKKEIAKKTKVWTKKAFGLVKYLPFAVLAGFIAVLLLFFYYTYNLPVPDQFTETPFTQSTKIYDRTGKVLLYDIYGEEKRTVVPFDQISQNLKNAVIASEDERFYQHGGIDIRGILRSIWIDIVNRSSSQGGSTITQQLVRSVFLSKEKTISRKIKEIILSIELDQRYSKDQILGWYLNEVPFGQNAYGAEAASQAYFNEPASDLTLAQAATLTALLPAPSYYSPYGSHKEQLLQKKDEILNKMEQQGYITKDQLEQAKSEQIAFSSSTISIKAPHFVMYVMQYLEQKYGDDFLKEKGLKVYTTLDFDLQQYAEKVIEDAQNYNLKYNANNTALVVVDPTNGQILTLIGSKDYFSKSYPEGCDKKAGGNCLFDPNFDVATMGLRQPGSSFKPFVYATALEQGYTANTILWDATTEFNINCLPDGTQDTDQFGNNCYHPKDYDGKNRGQVTLRSALDQSLNIPSVKLLYLVGLQNSLKTSMDLGITTLNDPDRYGLSLVLGGGEVTLLQMTSAYGVFANDGIKVSPSTILKIEDSNGNTIEENQNQPTKVLNTNVARQINDILSDNNARVPVFAANNSLHINGYDVAAKTGTTQNDNDAWTIGYAPFASVGVWVGNNDNSPTNQTGIGLAAPIWNKVMQKILQSHPTENFTAPQLNQNQTVNPILMGNMPQDNPPHSELYYIDKKNPLGPSPKESSTDPLYSFWELGVQNYLKQSLNSIPPL